LLGCYQVKGEVSQRLLAALPEVMHLPARALDTPLVPMLVEEIAKDEPGQGAVLDRLFDLLLVAVLRAWLAREQERPPGWYAAQGDPVVGPALRILHEDPARPWTIAELAARVGISRAALARRFVELVGEPPMTYLTRWRIALAADRLLEPQATVDAVAREVGYSSAFALSTAFKRERGVSPSEHRARPALQP
jgi:AraC-like DNA-binding protein